MKSALTLELILQGVDRLPACDAVWLAVPASRRGRDRDRRAHTLCRMLGFGLLAVVPSTGRSRCWPSPRHTSRGRTPSAAQRSSASTGADAGTRRQAAATAARS
jgi:hypothetical protein